MPKKKNNAEEKVKTSPATTASAPPTEFVRCPSQKAALKGRGLAAPQ
jgi:hypothetical protein